MKNKEQVNKYREMSVADLYKQVRVLQNEIIEQKDAKDVHDNNKKRKHIARIKTVLTEKKIINNE